MTPLHHRYEVQLSGGVAGYAQVSAAGLPDLRVAAPVDFDGPGDAWSPEHLLLAAVQSCFLLTLRGVARASRVDIVSVAVDAAGTVDRRDGITRFTEIVLHARVIVVPGTDRNRVQRVLEKSEKGCLVAASLTTPVRLDTEIVEGDTPAVLAGADAGIPAGT